MAKGFSVFVNIGGKLNSSLGNAVKGAKSQIAGLNGHIHAVNTRTQATINNYGRGIAAAGKRMQNTGTALSASITAPLGLLGKVGFDAAYQFEKVGNAVQAVSNITDEQRKSLNSYVKSLNAAFPFTNSEIMTANLELQKGGLNYEQAFGALKPTLNLAAAGDIDLSSAADISSNILMAMNLPRNSAVEAQASITKVADTLAYAANKSSTDVRLMGETFKYVGPMARAAGMDINRVTAASMIMADNGIKGSEAGVAMRSALVRMVKPTKPMMAALARLNLDLGQFVKTGREVTSQDIVGSLAIDGIDASGSQKAIARILGDKRLQAAPEKMVAALTNTISKSLGSDSVVDKDKLSDSISTALTSAGSEVDLGGFMKALKDRGATLGDIANIFDARQGARLITLLFQGDLNSAAEEVAKNAAGAADRMREIRMKGIVGEVGELSAAWENLWITLGETGVMRDIGRGLTAIADILKILSAQSPTLLRFAVWGAMATAALGPFMLVTGSVMRVLGPLATGLLTLGRAATLGLASRLVAVAGGIRAVAIASALGAAGRLRAMAAGLMMLSTVGGSRAVLGAIGGSIVSFGKSVLMFPVTALRAIGGAMWALVANPVGAIIAGIVLALSALGLWVYNNWEGIKSFFSGFAEGFSSALGPQATGWLNNFVSALSSIWKWVNDLLGPINATNEEWKGWGATVGGIVGGAVNTVANGIERVIGLFKMAYDGAVSLGNAIASLGGGGGPAPTPPHVSAGLSRGGPIPVAGARAAGGPVRGGLPYLVGERGPEVMVPGSSGSIIPNNRLRRLTSGEALAQASGRPAGGVGGDRSQVIHFHINGAQDPAAIRREIEQFMRRLESEQRGMLSD